MQPFGVLTRIFALVLTLPLIAYGAPAQARHAEKGNIIEPDWTPVIILGVFVVVAAVGYIILSRLEDSPAVESEDTESVQATIGGQIPRCIKTRRLGELQCTYGRILTFPEDRVTIPVILDDALSQHSSSKYTEEQGPATDRSGGDLIRSADSDCEDGLESLVRQNIR